MSHPNQFDDAQPAIARAMAVAQCPGGDYDHAQHENFPIGGGQADDVCQRIVGCDPLHPLVVCPVPGFEQTGVSTTAIPGFFTFLRLFNNGPLFPPR